MTRTIKTLIGYTVKKTKPPAAMSTRLVVDVIGWAGAAALLAAYGLVSAKRLDGDSMTYQLLNLIGAIFLIVNSTYYGAYPSTFVNVVWIGIAVVTMLYVKKKALDR